MSKDHSINSIYNQEIPLFLDQALQTDVMQRLKGIDMNCGMQYTSFPFFKDLLPYSRYEHSLGVGLIVWHFTKDKTQALAGLFHDVATPVFSHVIDFLNHDYENQESTESLTHELLANSKDVQTLLNELNIDISDIDDYHRYPVADNDTPKLSADRLEYTLGVFLKYGYLPKKEIQELYEDLVVGINEFNEEEIMFQRVETAQKFTQYSLKGSDVFTCPADRYGMEMLARVIKKAIDEGILTYEDLYTSEANVIVKIEKSNIAKEWYDFKKLSKIMTNHTPFNDQWIQIPSKKRYINPYVIHQGRIIDLDENIKKAQEAFLEKDFKEYLYAE